MKFNIKLAAESMEKEPGVETTINESTKFEDADPQRIASELELLERQGYEVSVTATAKNPK